MIINVLIAVPLGILAAYRRGRAADVAARFVALLGAALPVFWLGLLLQLLFSVVLGWLPLYGQIGMDYAVPTITGAVTLDALLSGNLAAFGSALSYLLLPAVTLAASFIAVIARTVRSSMITALDADYVSLARATGAGEFRVVVAHGFRNALIPMTTILGMQLGWMLGTTVLVESTFNRTGIGAYMVTAVLQNDLYPVIGAIIVIGIVFIVTNLAVDVLQLWINPRLRDGAAPRRAAVAAPTQARTGLAPIGGAR
nr:ABC transporter permease [Microbacterium excoecariae]